MAASEYTQNMVSDGLYHNGTWTNPTTWYLALHTANPGTVGQTNELTIGTHGYARQAITWGADDGTPDFITLNTAEMTFTASGGDWAEVSYFTINDALTAGNCLDRGAMSNARTILDGGSLVVAVGALSVKTANTLA